jgi:hypothetical protein
VSTPDLPTGYGQIIYDGYRERAHASVAPDLLREAWGELPPDNQALWDGAAADLIAYLERIPR